MSESESGKISKNKQKESKAIEDIPKRKGDFQRQVLNHEIRFKICLFHKETCLLPHEEGLCHESQIKYYFDRTKLMCNPFEFR